MLIYTQDGEQVTAEGRTYTMRELSQRTAQVIEEINESGEQALITKHGRIVALVTPLQHAQVESIVLSQGPIAREIQARIDADPGPRLTSDEVADRIRRHYSGQTAPEEPVPASRPRRRAPRTGRGQ
jgi:antitoxin (DNA-binding transcriptional repressor) of toxin-antitoxin stability system